MTQYLPELTLVLALVLVNAVFAGTEIALITLREGQLRRMEAGSRSGRRVAELARDPNRFLATIQIGITLAGFLASATAAVSLAEPLVGPLSFLGRAAGPVSIVLVTLVLSYLTLVLGELAPKRLGLQWAERWAMVCGPALYWMSVAVKPVVALLGASTDLVVRLFGGDPRRRTEEVSTEELRDMVLAHGTFSTEQRTVVIGALELEHRRLRQVLRPRGAVFSLDAALTAAEALELLTQSGHTRAPVAEDGDLDHTVGVVRIHDLLGVGNDLVVRDLARDVPFFPESLRVLTAMRVMQTERHQMAMVISEHGSVEGIVTIEDLVEEVVGEIYDEGDRDVRAIRRERDGTVVLAGDFPVHDLVDVGVELPGGEYTSVAGLILDRLGRLPDRPGDRVRVGNWELTVSRVHRRAITEVVLRPAPAREDGAITS